MDHATGLRASDELANELQEEEEKINHKVGQVESIHYYFLIYLLQSILSHTQNLNRQIIIWLWRNIYEEISVRRI